MEIGDKVLFYHSVFEKAVIGIAKITRAAFPESETELEIISSLAKN